MIQITKQSCSVSVPQPWSQQCATATGTWWKARSFPNGAMSSMYSRRSLFHLIGCGFALATGALRARSASDGGLSSETITNFPAPVRWLTREEVENMYPRSDKIVTAPMTNEYEIEYFPEALSSDT